MQFKYRAERTEAVGIYKVVDYSSTREHTGSFRVVPEKIIYSFKQSNESLIFPEIDYIRGAYRNPLSVWSPLYEAYQEMIHMVEEDDIQESPKRTFSFY